MMINLQRDNYKTIQEETLKRAEENRLKLQKMEEFEKQLLDKLGQT